MSRALGLLLLALLLGGCAWSNRANRPVWNEFESRLVPDSTPAFYATLPLTIPGGLVAILADTFVAHPIQVADDAWDDAGDLWRTVPWTSEYYTQMGLLPFRAVATPIVFLGSFLGRSCFDLPPHGTRAARPAAGEDAATAQQRVAAEEEQARHALLEALDRVAKGTESGAELGAFPAREPYVWTPELQAAWERAVAGASPSGRLQLFRYARSHRLAPGTGDPALGLRDPDPVVRYEMLRTLGDGVVPPRDVIDALLADPEPVIRALARDRWG